FTPESKARQAAAVAFLNANAFATPAFLVQPAVTRRFEPDGSLDLMRTSQTAVLNRLFQDARLERLIELRAEDGAAAYSPSQFMNDVRDGIWSELRGGSVEIDAYRRNLQDSYIGLLGRKLAETAPGMREPQALVRADLIALNGEIHRALPQAHAAATRAHLVASIDAIDKALDPKFAPAAAAAGPFARGLSGEDGLICWPDVRVTRDGVAGLGGGGN
ncbi:MAG: zinc-dependent metalloprotease, partial [Terriglobales bacterium]